MRFDLELLEPLHFEPGMILNWRKDLLRGARLVCDQSRREGPSLEAFLNPLPAADPVARKRFQKPAPPFIINPELRSKAYSSGDTFSLELLFPGDGVHNVGQFLEILTGLGQVGFYKGTGRFEVARIRSLTHTDGWQTVWERGGSVSDAFLPILKVSWLFEERPLLDRPLAIRFLTPARLLKNSRPLFAAGFKDLFPFILRRVTSVLYYCCRIELDSDLSLHIEDAAAVRSQFNSLKWVDWRYLDANHGAQGVGGLSGAIHLSGGLTEDLYTILQLAEIFHIGKWASYGAGCFVLEPVQSGPSEIR